MPDSPDKAWFFNAEEKKLAAIRLAPNQTGVESRKVCSQGQYIAQDANKISEIPTKSDR